MKDRERLDYLTSRLTAMRAEPVPTWQRPILDVAIRAIEEEIARLSQRIAHRRREGLVA